MKAKHRQKSRPSASAQTLASPQPAAAVARRGAGAPRAARIVVALILIGATYLAFKGLGTTAFWDDEADVAIISRNALSSGQLSGWDGRNLYAQRNGTVLDKDLNIINPPLMYWMCAASFKVFGPGTWAGRFPFALCGLLTLAAFALLLRHDFAPGPWLWLYALGGLGLSPVYLLYIRQCRYFAPCLLFAVLFFYGYRRFLATGRSAALALLAGSAIGLFYANYMTCTAFLLAVGVVHLVFHRRVWGARQWRGVALAGAAFLAATLPYALAHRIWVRPDHATTEPALQRHLTLLWWSLRDLNLMGAIPWMFALAAAALIALRYRRDPAAPVAAQWGLLALANVVLNALLSPQTVRNTEQADVRYLVASLPLLAGLTGFLLAWVHGKSRLAALGLFLTLLSCNLLFWTPGGGFMFHWFLPGYLYEIHHDYPTPYGEAARFLRENARQDDLVLVRPDFANYPVMFYAGDKVRFACLLTRESPLAPQVAGRLKAPLLLEENSPDWYITLGLTAKTLQDLDFFCREHVEAGRTVRYTYRLTRQLDVYALDHTRPEIYQHTFAPITRFDRRKDAVYVYRRFDVLKR